MGATSPGGAFRRGLFALGISLLAFSVPGQRLRADAEGLTGTQEKLIVARGRVALELDVQRVGQAAGAARTRRATVRFDLERDAFLTVVVFNGELRAPLPGSARLIPLDAAALPASLAARDLVLEQASVVAPHELVIRDGSSGIVVFNVQGQQYTYDPRPRGLAIRGGRLVLSEEFAAELGRPAAAGSVVGGISMAATMRPIEVTHVIAGEVQSDFLPSLAADQALVPGPDVIVGNVSGLAQFGSASATQVGLALGTDSCNAGTENLNWFALPSNDHPVIPQNLYRMSGGANNDERFEQIGQSNVKHAFTALTDNICGFGCNGVGGSHLGSGCSDPYSASLNAGPDLGSKAWINPFTGFYPRGDSPTPPNSHAGHVHNGTSHRILTNIADLNTANNAGATYYAEGQYVTPHEYAWCQAHPGECNMNNNVSYRRYSVTGTTGPFSFSPVGATVRTEPAINAWTGATRRVVQPAPEDGIVIVGYKVTNPSAGVWHYEYAIYNQNLDRAVQSFSLPKRSGVVISNSQFHAPPQHPGWSADGTPGNAGFNDTPWRLVETAGLATWSSETMAENPNANAIRWGTLYNIRFDANQPPIGTGATLGFFKTGAPATVLVEAPAGTDPTCSRNGPC
jgi:hypothetical protein